MSGLTFSYSSSSVILPPSLMANIYPSLNTTPYDYYSYASATPATFPPATSSRSRKRKADVGEANEAHKEKKIAERPKCTLCGKDFFDRPTKDRHVRTQHKGVRYICRYLDSRYKECGHESKRLDGLRKHMLCVHQFTLGPTAPENSRIIIRPPSSTPDLTDSDSSPFPSIPSPTSPTSTPSPAPGFTWGPYQGYFPTGGPSNALPSPRVSPATTTNIPAIQQYWSPPPHAPFQFHVLPSNIAYPSSTPSHPPQYGGPNYNKLFYSVITSNPHIPLHPQDLPTAQMPPRMDGFAQGPSSLFDSLQPARSLFGPDEQFPPPFPLHPTTDTSAEAQRIDEVAFEASSHDAFEPVASSFSPPDHSFPYSSPPPASLPILSPPTDLSEPGRSASLIRPSICAICCLLAASGSSPHQHCL